MSDRVPAESDWLNLDAVVVSRETAAAAEPEPDLSAAGDDAPSVAQAGPDVLTAFATYAPVADEVGGHSAASDVQGNIDETTEDEVTGLRAGVEQREISVATDGVSRETESRGSGGNIQDLPLPPVSRETRSFGSELSGPLSPGPMPASGSFGATSSDLETPIAREAAQAVQVLNVRQESWPRPARTRVMTVANQKGGVGKTTSAVNIAAALALHGQRVLLIDLDPQGNASTALGIEHGVGTPSIYDVLLGGQLLAEVAQVADFAADLRCVPATIDLAGADIELTSQVAREYRLQRALLTFLESDQAEVDYVLIDCPPSLGLLTLNALVAAREVLLPIQCEYYALEGLAQLLKTVELVTSHLNPDLLVTTVLLTMYDSRTRLADQVADEVRRHFGDLVLTPTIPRNVRVSEAPGFGQTVITYDPGSRGAIGYVQAAHEIAIRGARGDYDEHGREGAGGGPAGVAEGDA